MTPHLKYDPVMGVAHDEVRAQRQVSFNSHIYLSDFTSVRLVGVDLRDKHFFGCKFGPSTLVGTNSDAAHFVACIFSASPPAHAEISDLSSVNVALNSAALATLSTDASQANNASTEYYFQLLDASSHHRLPSNIFEIHLAFTCTWKSPPALQEHPSKEFTELPRAVEASVESYLVDRLGRGDREEVANLLRHLIYCQFDISERLTPPVIPYLLRHPYAMVRERTLDFIQARCRLVDDFESLFGPEPEELVRAVLGDISLSPGTSVFYILRDHPRLIPYDLAIAMLDGPEAETRSMALCGLWERALMPTQRCFLLDHDPSDDERLQLIEWEQTARDTSEDGHLVERDEFPRLVSSPLAATRAEALRFLGFSGDPVFEPDARQALKDEDEEVRMYAVRALRWMSHVDRDDPEILALKTDASERVREEVQAFATSTPPPSPAAKEPEPEPEPEPGFPLAIVDEAKLNMFALIETLRDVAGLRLDDATTLARELRLTGSALLDVEADEIEAAALALAKYGVAFADASLA